MHFFSMVYSLSNLNDRIAFLGIQEDAKEGKNPDENGHRAQIVSDINIY